MNTAQAIAAATELAEQRGKAQVETADRIVFARYLGLGGKLKMVVSVYDRVTKQALPRGEWA
jgi:hypothetical protein